MFLNIDLGYLKEFTNFILILMINPQEKYKNVIFISNILIQNLQINQEYLEISDSFLNIVSSGFFSKIYLEALIFKRNNFYKSIQILSIFIFNISIGYNIFKKNRKFSNSRIFRNRKYRKNRFRTKKKKN